MNYLKIALYVGLFAIGFGVAWSWQGARLDAVKTELKVCASANLTNQQTISNMEEEIAKSNKTCEARLKSKDRALRELKEIDELKGGKGEKGNSNPTGNAVLDALNRLF
jgi:cell division protein FtsX